MPAEQNARTTTIEEEEYPVKSKTKQNKTKTPKKPTYKKDLSNLQPITKTSLRQVVFLHPLQKMNLHRWSNVTFSCWVEGIIQWDVPQLLREAGLAMDLLSLLENHWL